MKHRAPEHDVRHMILFLESVLRLRHPVNIHQFKLTTATNWLLSPDWKRRGR